MLENVIYSERVVCQSIIASEPDGQPQNLWLSGTDYNHLWTVAEMLCRN